MCLPPLHFLNRQLIYTGMASGILSCLLCLIGLSSVYLPEKLAVIVCGCTLGGYLSLGLVLVNHWYRKSLDQEQPPPLKGVMFVSLTIGCLAAVSCSGIYAVADWYARGVPLLSWRSGIPALAYALILLPAYHRGWYVPRAHWFSGIVLGGFVSGVFWAVWTALFVPYQSSEPIDFYPLELIFAPFFKGIVFAICWGCIATRYDPGKTFETWKKTRGVLYKK
jgi:hypothetical protein